MINVNQCLMHSLHTALQGLALGEMGWKFVAAGAELEGLLQLLEHLLVGAERDSFRLSLNGSPYENQFKNLVGFETLN